MNRTGPAVHYVPASLPRRWRGTLCACLMSIAGLTLGLAPVYAQRHALVIGNGAYEYAKRLPNAPNDATDVAAALKKAGWEVTAVRDAGVKEMLRGLRVFCESASGAEAALFFYAGHGMEVKGANYLLPVDAELAEADGEDALQLETLALDKVLRSMAGAGIRLKTVVLDCCRDNPLDRSWLATSRGGGSGGGLAEVKEGQLPEGAMLVFSTAPGKTASDGTHRNSPFTAALLSRMQAGGGSVANVFGDVASTLGSRQAAWIRFDGSGVSYAAFNKYPLVPGAGPSGGMAPPMTAADRLRAATVERPFVNSLGLEFVPVPGKPGVYMCRTETRVRDFRAYATATDYRQTGWAAVTMTIEDAGGVYSIGKAPDDEASWENPGFAQTEDHPVVCVSWDEAHEFCEWLSGQENGLTYRLPSDAEWSAAVGSLGKYPWGNEWPAPKGTGNYAGAEKIEALPGKDSSTAYDYNDGNWTTARVASYRVNRFGFYDLGGNVSECCEDLYRESMNDEEILAEFPGLRKEALSNTMPYYRVARGGSWTSEAEEGLRSSFRGICHYSIRSDDMGFRVVVEAAP